jgi:hypothetical protein
MMQSSIQRATPKPGLHPLIDLGGCMTLIKGNIKIMVIVMPPHAVDLPGPCSSLRRLDRRRRVFSARAVRAAE